MQSGRGLLAMGQMSLCQDGGETRNQCLFGTFAENPSRWYFGKILKETMGIFLIRAEITGVFVISFVLFFFLSLLISLYNFYKIW